MVASASGGMMLVLVCCCADANNLCTSRAGPDWLLGFSVVFVIKILGIVHLCSPPNKADGLHVYKHVGHQLF